MKREEYLFYGIFCAKAKQRVIIISMMNGEQRFEEKRKSLEYNGIGLVAIGNTKNSYVVFATRFFDHFSVFSLRLYYKKKKFFHFDGEGEVNCFLHPNIENLFSSV